MLNAFGESKKAIVAAVELAHPAAAAEIFLAVDASSSHVGAVLQQREAGRSARPLVFFSAKLDAAQVKYSTFDRELLACYLAIRHFRWLLEGRQFYILSDHKPLCFALHRLSAAVVRHVAGVDNVVADALSHPAAAVALPTQVKVDLMQLARAQATCGKTLQLAAGSSLQIQELLVDGVKLLCDVSSGAVRPLVPT
jgi:cleavage and polyadenylation specificity factor subunit 1